MKFQNLVAFAALIVAGIPAFANHVDYARSQISFVSTQMNVAVTGRFKQFTARIAFDPAKPAASKAEIAVDLASVDTGSDEADAEVVKKGWFNVLAFPDAKFVSDTVRKTGPDRYEATGKLSIKGMSQEVTAPFGVKRSGDVATYEGGFTLKRLQFKIGEGIWSDTDTVADDVQVKFLIVTTGNK
ncbi:MAG: YceI family protein [Burkholderiales bacterium]